MMLLLRCSKCLHKIYAETAVSCR